MPDEFQYDMILSHSAKDKAVKRVSSLFASNGERAGGRCRSFGGSGWAQLDRHYGTREPTGCRRFRKLRQVDPRWVRMEAGFLDLKRSRLLDIAWRR